MKSVMTSIAALALMSTSAVACPFMKTADDHTMSVASLDRADVPISTSEDALREADVVDEMTTSGIEDGKIETAE